MKFKSLLSVMTGLAAGAAMTFALGYSAPLAHAGNAGDNYDRLDGTGASGEKVQVIEWEGNLEIHVYPKGSVAGLGLKLDKRNKDRPVMVIAYRFADNPHQTLIRRNILGIPMYDGFKVYKDPMENDFDKFIISNNGLSGDLISYKLDPSPTQLYPDGSPMLANGSQQNSNRAPASVDSGATPAGSAGGYTSGSQPSQPDDAGTLHPFFMDQGGRGGR